MLSWAHHISHLSEECEMPIMCRSSKTASLLDVKLPTHCCIMRLTAQHRDVFECCLHLKCVLLFIFCLFILWTEHKLLLGPTEPWSVREKLCLASSVMKSGDQNWWFFYFYTCISLRKSSGSQPFWFQGSYCLIQYSKAPLLFQLFVIFII